MIPLAALKALPWRLIGYGVAVAAVLALGWRVHAWREAYKALPGVEAELAAERACEPASACEKRLATLALEAEQRAAAAAAEATRAASEREEKARADAAAWRARYRAAVQENPECADWSSQLVRCPL